MSVHREYVSSDDHQVSLAGGGYVLSDGHHVSLAGGMFPVIATRCHSRGYGMFKGVEALTGGWVCLGFGMYRVPVE